MCCIPEPPLENLPEGKDLNPRDLDQLCGILRGLIGAVRNLNERVAVMEARIASQAEED